MSLKLPTREQVLYMVNVLAGKYFFNKKKRNDIESVLVVKLDEIGDMATSTHVFQLLKQAYPKAKLTLLCKPFVKGLVAHDPYIDEVFTSTSQWKKQYDLVVELRGKYSTFFKAFRYVPKIRLSRADIRLENRGKQVHETITNYLTVLPALEKGAEQIDPKLYFNQSDSEFVETYLNTKHLVKFAILHVSARKKLRQWNTDRFALVADYLKQKYDLSSVFIGSDNEKEDIGKVRSLMKEKSIDGSGVFNLSQLSCLCTKASFFLGNESGPMNIAAAFKLPMLALFGPGVPVVFYPKHTNAAVLHHVLSCNPCDQIHCVQPDNPCISMIQVGDVLQKIDEILH